VKYTNNTLCVKTDVLLVFISVIRGVLCEVRVCKHNSGLLSAVGPLLGYGGVLTVSVVTTAHRHVYGFRIVSVFIEICLKSKDNNHADVSELLLSHNLFSAYVLYRNTQGRLFSSSERPAVTLFSSQLPFLTKDHLAAGVFIFSTFRLIERFSRNFVYHAMADTRTCEA
jgi:hypothetical protein